MNATVKKVHFYTVALYRTIDAKHVFGRIGQVERPNLYANYLGTFDTTAPNKRSAIRRVKEAFKRGEILSEEKNPFKQIENLIPMHKRQAHRTGFSISGTQTGRFTSTTPNMSHVDRSAEKKFADVDLTENQLSILNLFRSDTMKNDDGSLIFASSTFVGAALDLSTATARTAMEKLVEKNFLERSATVNAERKVSYRLKFTD